MRPQVEILAPAGSMESMRAAVNAGADAVYMGGSRFGARAYADNPEEDRFLEAIDHVHLHGCRIYMTVNTLVKEGELSQLPEFLRPYYRQGLDAVIVQDLGVWELVRRTFPDLHIHASTQMTVTGWRSAELLKKMGASRVVTARELSLEEIAQIRDKVDIEIESFVHGALCYCYSGQCLLSSLIGGRSGNRGRCAQPCRLPYDVAGQTGFLPLEGRGPRERQEAPAGRGAKERKSGPSGRGGRGRDPRERDVRERADRAGTGRNDRYLLSLKDLCTLDLLPDMIEAGVYSLKIEGRMKSPRYTAGVVSVYRKYVDRYLEYGREGYRVDPQDKRMLLELFDRGGFTDGYSYQHNGRDMVALQEKPAFREGNQALFDRLDADYVLAKKQEPVTGRVVLREGEPARLTLTMARGGAEDPSGPRTVAAGPDGDRGSFGAVEVTAAGPVVQTAQSQPLTEEKLLKQMNKTGGSPFVFTELKAELSGSCFLPVQALNQLRREGLEKLEEAVLAPYRRDGKGMPEETGAPAVPEVPEARSRQAADEGASPEARSRHAADEGASMEAQRSGSSVPGAWSPQLIVSLEDPAGLLAAAGHPEVDAVYVDSTGFGAETWKDAVSACRREGKACGLILPHIFRLEAERYLLDHQEELRSAGFDCFVVRSLEEPGFLAEVGLQSVPQVYDANLYAMNRQAAGILREAGACRLTLPFEENSRELEQLVRAEHEAWEGHGANGAQGVHGGHGAHGMYGKALPWELVVYGHYPAMVSAQCIVRTTKGCTGKPEVLRLKDRMGKELPVKNHCRFCYNTIYNPSPLSLLGQRDAAARLAPQAVRLSFTTEPPEELTGIISRFAEEFRYGRDAGRQDGDFTRGHFKRGVE